MFQGSEPFFLSQDLIYRSAMKINLLLFNPDPNTHYFPLVTVYKSFLPPASSRYELDRHGKSKGLILVDSIGAHANDLSVFQPGICERRETDNILWKGGNLIFY